MPQFTFEAPDGQRHTIEGPEGATKEQAFQMLQQHLGQGQPSAADSYHSKLTDALNVAMKALAPSWEHNNSSYSPYKPAQPGNLPNDAINPVGTDAQMVAALGAAGAARAVGSAGAAGAARAAGTPSMAPVNMSQMPTAQSFAAQMAQNVGAAPSMAIGAGAAPQAAAGNALQTQLLQAAAKHGATTLGHAIGGPIGGLAAKFIPKVLGF